MCEQWKDSNTQIKWKKMRKYIWIDLVHICICLNRLLVTESLTFPMWTLLSEHGAGAGLVSVEPPSGSQGGGAMAELTVTDSWFVGAITDNSESNLLDSINHLFQWSRRSLVWAISCRHFPSWEALLWAILARACAAYSSTLATWVRVTLLGHIC